MEQTSPNQPIDLRDALRPIKSRLWLIVVCVSLATALTYYHYSAQPKQYRATTSLYIGSTDPTQLLNSGASDRETTDLAALIQSSSVASIAARSLGYRGDPGALVGSVTAAPVPGSDFVGLTDTAGNPVEAAALVNAVADAFVVDRTNAIHSQAAQAIAQAERNLAALPHTLATDTTRAQLSQTIQTMQNLEALPSAGVKHVNPAFPPAAPFAPNPKKNAIFAFVITLMLSIAGAYGLERLDRRIRKLAEIEPVYGYPVLAAVPRTAKPSASTDGAAMLPDDLREAFRKLRMNLQLSAIEQAPKTIVVTSAVPREGKSTVTRNLALAYREAGLEVCVIDADLRRPVLADLLNVPNVPGLTDVIVGDETLTGALKRAAAGVPGLRTLARLQAPTQDGVPVRSELVPARSDDLSEPDVGSVVVLPAGPEPANPPVVLGSDQMRSILSTLSANFDVVLIDTSPLLAVSDAVPLLSTADGVVVVSRLAMTTTDSAEDVVEQIRRIPGANLLGVVANDVSAREAGVKGHLYGYGHSRTTA